MFTLLIVVLTAGLLPLSVAVIRLRRDDGRTVAPSMAGSVVLGTLAFNLTFLWQEVWLCIPKALTPGLSPVLYHNNHEWTGDAPIAELLQGTGAVATMVLGLACAAMLANLRRPSPKWQVFLFWMAFEGVFQSLSQVALGSAIRGNDIGRALQYLGFNELGRTVVFAGSLAAMACAGWLLAGLLPGSIVPSRTQDARLGGRIIAMTCGLIVLLCVPFRIPRNPVEVLVVPTVVNLMGAAWLLLAITCRKQRPSGAPEDPPRIAIPLLLLAFLLVFFQAVLRRGIAF